MTSPKYPYNNLFDSDPNLLLSLLGVEMSSEPFGGSRSLKSILDYMADKKFSDKYIAPPPVY